VVYTATDRSENSINAIGVCHYADLLCAIATVVSGIPTYIPSLDSGDVCRPYASTTPT